jgi:dCMP deaminase
MKEEIKEKYLLAFMDMTERFGLTSEAQRLKVGASIVKNGAIISLGVNGTYAGWPTNACEDEEGNTNWFVRHAERAALDKLVKSTESSEGATMFVSHSPCKFCALAIKDAGIKKVYYRHTYRDDSGVKYLQDNGVVVEQI